MTPRKHLENLVAAWAPPHGWDEAKIDAFADALRQAIDNVDDASFQPCRVREDLDTIAAHWNALHDEKGCPDAFDVESELHFLMRYGIQAVLNLTKEKE
jgi:hypothetical protein